MPDEQLPIIDAFLKGVPPEEMIKFAADTKKRADKIVADKEAAIENLKQAAPGISGAEALFKGAFSSIISDIEAIFPTMIERGLEKVSTWYTDKLKAQLEKDLDPAVRDGLISKEAKTSLLGLADKNPTIAYLIGIALMLTSHLTYYGHTFKAAQSEGLQRINAEYRPNLFGPGELVRAAFLSPGDTPKVRELLARLGYKEDAIDLYFKAHYSTYSVQEAFSLWRRGVLDDGKLVERLRENGFTDERIEEIKELSVVIPSISDIIYMLGKEAFEEDQVRQFGLDAEYPPEAEQWAAKHGLDPYWVKRYWRAHWNHAAPGQVLEMLHRGVVDEETVRQYYRVVEIPPYWRDKLMAISYMPYTRVDVRRMYQLGIIGTEEVYRSYLDQGYDETHALNLTKYSVAYKIEAERDLTVTDVLNGFKAGILDRTSTITFLTNLGYSADEAEYKVTYAEYTERLKEQNEAIAIIGGQYQAGLIEEELARTSLREILVDEKAVDRYIAKWSVAYSKTRRHPTKSELDKLVLSGIITADQYVYEMLNLGYSEKHIEWYLQYLAVEAEGG